MSLQAAIDQIMLPSRYGEVFNLSIKDRPAKVSRGPSIAHKRRLLNLMEICAQITTGTCDDYLSAIPKGERRPHRDDLRKLLDKLVDDLRMKKTYVVQGGRRRAYYSKAFG